MCFKNVLNKPLFMVTPQKKAQCVPGSLKQNRTFRLSEGTGLSMEKIQHQFFNSSMIQEIYGDRVSAGSSE